MLSNPASQLAFLVCDKFRIGPKDQMLNLKGTGLRCTLNDADVTLLAGVLKANSSITSIE